MGMCECTAKWKSNICKINPSVSASMGGDKNVARRIAYTCTLMGVCHIAATVSRLSSGRYACADASVVCVPRQVQFQVTVLVLVVRVPAHAHQRAMVVDFAPP